MNCKCKSFQSSGENTFFKSFGEIEYVSVLMTKEEVTSIFKLKLKDNLRDIVISL